MSEDSEFSWPGQSAEAEAGPEGSPPAAPGRNRGMGLRERIRGLASWAAGMVRQMPAAGARAWWLCVGLAVAVSGVGLLLGVVLLVFRLLRWLWPWQTGG